MSVRRLFRRQPAGRHALGAAVTAIPSGPLVVPAPPAVVPLPVPPDPEPVVVHTSAPVPEVAVSETVVAQPPAQAPAAQTSAAAVHVPVQALPPAAPAAPAPVVDIPAQGGPVNESALLDELLALAAPVDAAPPAVTSAPALRPAPVLAPNPPDRPGPRVELGFADGTYRMLDPASETAHLLAELVGELTTPAGPPRAADDAPAEGSGQR